MTDIDAIRKAKRYAPRELCALGVESEGRYTVATALDAALAAYDAKCEELAIYKRRDENGFKLYMQACAERDAAVRDAQAFTTERFRLVLLNAAEACDFCAKTHAQSEHQEKWAVAATEIREAEKRLAALAPPPPSDPTTPKGDR